MTLDEVEQLLQNTIWQNTDYKVKIRFSSNEFQIDHTRLTGKYNIISRNNDIYLEMKAETLFIYFEFKIESINEIYLRINNLKGELILLSNATSVSI